MSDNKTALVIDPERDDRADLARWLRGADWIVIEAADGDTGLLLAREHEPSLVFCDAHAPGRHGFQICRALRSPDFHASNLRIVLTTGSDYEALREDAVRAGADDYLVKPIIEADLLQFLTQIHRQGSVTEILRAASPRHKARPASDIAAAMAERIPTGALSVRFWGVRGSIPTPGRATLHYGGNTSCVEARADGQLIVLDAGTGIRELGISLAREFADQPLALSLLISHTHWDHIQGLPFFEPAYNPNNRLRIIGAEGASEGLLATLSSQMESPYFPVGWRKLPSHIEIQELKEASFRLGGVTVDTFFLNHPGVCLGYRLNAAAGSVVYLPDNEPFQRYKFHSTGSTEFLRFARRKDQQLSDFARDADILIVDSQYDAAEYQTRVGWGHGCVDDAVAMALNANARRLFLFHHDPAHDDDKVSEMTQWARQFVAALGENLEVEAAREGLDITLGPSLLAAEPVRAVA